ncbi:hypothetical protein MIND_00890800 [Mycena indigotica]|uniref:Transmembrane protein n=1 Tax=Mycena indigotica TaxID=2126181 RepID=A0A8H6SKC3_9AGAR|nr:uncharacterized protein MIND_00890800 [Mycena indigotica]KAF7299410.1 hypothetical protein MIND_00890800 [Mycena indigotica]
MSTLSSLPPPSSQSSAPPSSSQPSSQPPSSSNPVSSSQPPSSSQPISSSPSSTLPSSSAPQASSVRVSTAPGGSVFTITSTQSITQSGTPNRPSNTAEASNNGFFQNKAAVGATFAIVGLVAIGIIFALITNTIRRRRARRFDREIAEEAKRVPAPVFMDDDDYNDHGYSAYGAGGAADAYGHAAPQSHSQHADGYPASGEGTPSNYMYPSGYSDLGFSDVSSHGTYAQQPMEAQYNAAGAYGAGAAGYGAYEMTGYATGHGGQMPGYGAPQQQQDWGGHAQQAYVYPGDEQQAHAGYPPVPSAASGSATAISSDSGALARNKSAGGARSLVDSYNTPPVDSAKTNTHAMPQYADGYVAQYQQSPHIVEEEASAYGGVESEHGHVGHEYRDEEDDAGHAVPRVLKVANE